MIEVHLLKSCSGRRKVMSLISAEAASYATLKGACQATGLASMAMDFCDIGGLSVKIDVGAALAIAQRQGLGNMRHVEVHYLWVQEKIEAGEIIDIKVCGENNQADAPTKNVKRKDLERFID